MAKKFRDAFIEALAASDLRVPDIARISGVSADQLNKLKQRPQAKTNADDAVRIANAFGYSIDEFVQDRTIKDRSEVAALYSQLTDRERDFLRVAAKASRD